MKLNSQQIDQLYAFTKQHFVEHYDLQTELVDHLANGIEQQWSQNPNISFDEALSKEFKKFGIFGFSDIVEKRTRTLEKKYWKFLWKTFKTFFGIPKIIATICLIFTVFQILILSNRFEYFLLIFILPLVYFIRQGYRNQKIYNKKTKIEGRKWLLEELIFSYGSGVLSLNLFVQILLNGRHTFGDEVIKTEYLFFMAILISLFMILSYIIIFHIPKRAEEYLKDHYPEYKFS
jgi:hypothetical protein